MSHRKRRSGGTLAPNATARACAKRLPAKDVQASQLVGIEGLRSRSGCLFRQARLFMFNVFNQRLAPLDLPSARYSVLRPARKSGIVADPLSVVSGIGRFKIVPVLDVLKIGGRNHEQLLKIRRCSAGWNSLADPTFPAFRRVDRGEDCAYLFSRRQPNEGLS